MKQIASALQINYRVCSECGRRFPIIHLRPDVIYRLGFDHHPCPQCGSYKTKPLKLAIAKKCVQKLGEFLKGEY